jgi:hypothetical protein
MKPLPALEKNLHRLATINHLTMKNLLTLVLLIACFAAMAQRNTEDVIYLKNGSVLRGKLTPPKAEAEAGKVSIELLGGSVFVFDKAEVDSVKKEDISKAQLARIKKDYYRKDRGYRNMTQLGFTFSVKPVTQDDYYYYNTNSQDDIGLSVQTVNGYQFWPYLYVGGGIGIDRFMKHQQTFSPFFVRVASEFLKRKVTPYVFIDGGYAVMWKQRNNDYQSFENKGGAYASAGGGIRIYTRGRASVIISAAYRMNMSESKWWYTGDQSGTYYQTKRTYQRMVVSAGVTF